MAQEIEKKFVLSAVPKGLYRGTQIRQGYITTNDPEVRVRDKGGIFFLTRKGGEGFIREEEEVEISREVFYLLWPITEGKRIEKIRYDVTGDDGLIWEVDQYQGILCGLVVAEVELPSEIPLFEMPDSIADVLVADVTFDKRYKNKALATSHIPVL
ncbi:MAG: adenylate cyclase [Leadbetterella sp.]|nr:adenylate cyclase [Leadbetterella sp.]